MTRRRSLTRVLHDITQVLGSVDAPEVRLRHVLELLREVVPFDVCALLEVHRGLESRSLIEPEPSAGERVEILATLDRLLSQLMAEQAQGPARAARSSSTVGSLAVPLVWSAEVIGIIFVRCAEEAYSESHLRALVVVSGQLAAYLSLLRAHDEILARAREIDVARRAAQAADRTKDELLAVMARQMKNPVAATLAWAHVLLATGAEQNAPSLAANAIERNARVLGQLIDDIQRLASVASTELRLDLRAEEPSPRGSAERPARVLDGISVLLVDDDPDIREAFQLALELSGAAVTVAASAAEALFAFERSRPDVLLCDICMPGEDGYDLMQRIAKLDPGLPAAALTGFADLGGRALAAGFRTQLTKPIEALALVSVVLELAGRDPAIAAPLRREA